MVARIDLEAELDRARRGARARSSDSESEDAIARVVHVSNDEGALEALALAARARAGLRVASVHVRSRDVQGSTREILEDKFARTHRALCAEGEGGSGDVARNLRRGLGGDVDYALVDVDSLEIRALRGYPGPLVGHAFETIGPDGVWDIVSRFVDRRAVWIYAIGVRCLQTGEHRFFESAVHGTMISPKVDGRSKSGVGSADFGTMFQPIGSLQTLSEMSIDERMKISPRHAAIEQLLTFFKATSSPATTFQGTRESQSARMRLSDDSGDDLPLRDTNIAQIAKQAVLRSSPASSSPTSLAELLETSTRPGRNATTNENVVEKHSSRDDRTNAPETTNAVEAVEEKARGRPPGRPRGRPPGRPSGRPPGRSSGRPPGRPPGRARRATGRSTRQATGRLPGPPRGRATEQAIGLLPGRPPGHATRRSPGRPRKHRLAVEISPKQLDTRERTGRERTSSLLRRSGDPVSPRATKRVKANTIDAGKSSLWAILYDTRDERLPSQTKTTAAR